MGRKKAGLERRHILYTSNTWKVKTVCAAAVQSNPMVQEDGKNTV